MKKYRIVIHGLGFCLRLNGKKSAVGFFSTFDVAANSMDEALKSVWDLLDARIKRNAIETGRFLGRGPVCFIETVSELDNVSDEIADGFTFYPQKFLDSIRFLLDAAKIKRLQPGDVIEYEKMTKSESVS